MEKHATNETRATAQRDAVKDFETRKACQYKPAAQASGFLIAAKLTRWRVGLVFYWAKTFHGVGRSAGNSGKDNSSAE